MFNTTRDLHLVKGKVTGPASATDQVYQLILDAIVNGRLTSGQAVLDHEWTTALGVSRTPVRNALQRLNALGLLEVAPARFTRLAAYAPDTAYQEARDWAALHQAVVTSVAPTVTTALLDQLRQAGHAYQQCIAEPGRRAANFAFFHVLRDATPNFALHLGANATAYRLRLAEPYLPNHPDAVTGLHTNIVTALHNGTPEAAHHALTTWTHSLTQDHALAA